MLPPEHEDVRRLIAKHGRFKLPRFKDRRWTADPHKHEGEDVEVVETIQLYVLYAEELNEQTARRAIIAFNSTALPVAQAYLTRHNSWTYRQPDGSMKPAALFSYRWRFSLVPQQNASGSWYNWKINLEPPGAKAMDALIPRNDPLFLMGREFYQLVKSGKVKPDYDAQQGNDKEDLPF
jgi:hypothetical protein